jgi:hypothetical protein
MFNVGIREILPVYPFFILGAASGAERLWESANGAWTLKGMAAGLLVVQALSVGLSFPGQISYFNELVSRDKKIFWLGDSNLDIGQDAKRLAVAARRRGWARVKLAYFGTTDPSAYGMKWEPWSAQDLKGPQPGWVYAVNAEFVQLGPAFIPDARAINGSWITSAVPSGKVGDTWFFYEIAGAPAEDRSPRLNSVLNYRVSNRDKP